VKNKLIASLSALTHVSEVASEEMKRSSRTNTGDQTPNFQLNGLAGSCRDSNG